jgi:ribosome-binding factor A
MAKDNRRADRVAEAIREEVAMALIGGANDPRIVGFVTVTGVDVTRDLRHAKVFVSVMGTVAEREQTLEGLAAIAPAIRTRIARVLTLHFAPTIAFHNDPTIERAARIETLLTQVKEGQAPAKREDGVD